MVPGWWARGLALHERLAGASPAPDMPGMSRRLLEPWLVGYGPEGAGVFAARLADTGLDTDVLVALLAEPAQCLAARTGRPGWADTIERAVRDAVPPAEGEPVPDDWREAFALPLRPLVDGACARVADGAAGLADIDLDTVLAGFASDLRARLVDLAVRTFVAELAEWRAAGRLDGADGRQRFADFVRRLSAPTGLATLFATYPVLARLLGQATEQAADAHLELLLRYAADRQAIVDTLLDGLDPGPLVSVRTGRGDRHRGGRTVALIAFGDGRQVVYRPSDVEPHLRFRTLVDWLNHRVPGLGLRAVTPVARPGYGWLEFIPAAPLADLESADRFYRRQGALLALLHALHAGDMHFENVIASGEWPVVVDVETLFHPTLTPPDLPVDAASAVLAASVHRTGLLPTIVVGEHGVADMSGLGGDRGVPMPTSVVDWADPATDLMRLHRRAAESAGAVNRPRLGGRDLDPGEHEPALLDGFRLGYDAVVRHAGELGDLLEDCAGLEVRLVVRPTRGYTRLLEESTNPDLLRDAVDRDRVLDVLWTEAVGHPLRWQVSRHELAELWAGDVPFFTARPGSHDVWTSDGERLPGLLDVTGLDLALEKIAAMCDLDRRNQEWIISATLATRRPTGEHNSVEPTLGPVSVCAAHPERLLAAACAIGDQIVARSMTDGNRVNWLGLELVDERQWLVLPMGAGYGNGYLGIALFLAQLCEVSGIGRYGEAALRAVRGIPALLDSVTTVPDLVPVIGAGALHGFGGIGYALARLAVLLDDADARRWALTCAEHAAAADRLGPADFATGGAGCLAALSAMHAELGEPSVAELAGACADRLADRIDAVADAGFAFGATGVGWALARFGGGRHAAARAALDRAAGSRRERSWHGWCAGLAGRAIAWAAITGPDADPELEDAMRVLADRPVLRNLSLCHGELGIAEVLTVLADAIDRYGTSCGTPNSVPTPGLLSGLAGIGFGLLRLGFADRVPSALLLESRPKRPGA
jgi:type 2 lantibiotic biosynthesis protein LanM